MSEYRGVIPPYDVPPDDEVPEPVDAEPVTIYALAEYRLGRRPVTGADFLEAGLEIMGGCAVCGATLAAYNACPSKGGYWLCLHGCIGDDGWTDVAEANRAIFAGEADLDEEVALDTIALLLDGEPWSADTVDAIAHLVRATGRRIGELVEDR